MRPKNIVNLFSEKAGSDLAREYLSSKGLLDLIEKMEAKAAERYKPDYRDLARLHAVVRTRRVFTILEFGIGYSTLVMADALSKNKSDWELLTTKPFIRNSTPFELHSVDSERGWIDIAISELPASLATIVKALHVGATSGTFNGKICHFYDALPNIVPDFVYLDGPHPFSVASPSVEVEKKGVGHWRNSDRVVMSADLLRLEPTLIPGTAILVDGRSANARFLYTNFYRNWSAAYNAVGDVTAFELQEAPYGLINRSALHYCLGGVVDEWRQVIPDATHEDL